MRPTPASDLHADIAARLKAYAALMRLNQPVGAYLLLWPTLWALWLASEGRPDEGLFIVFVIGVLVMRSAGCVINDFTDRRIDPYVERTRQRPLASGAVRPSEAVALFVSLGLVAVGLATTLNPLAQLIAAGAAVLTLVYPLIKRHLSVPQLVLGAAFASAVPMAFAAQTGNTPPLAWLTFSATLIWAVIYDTIGRSASNQPPSCSAIWISSRSAPCRRSCCWRCCSSVSAQRSGRGTTSRCCSPRR